MYIRFEHFSFVYYVAIRSWMGNTFFDQISAYRIAYLYAQALYSGNKILWKFSIIYESAILGDLFFCYYHVDGHWSQNHYYKYMQNELREKRKRYMMGPNEYHHPKKENWKEKYACYIGRDSSSKLLKLTYIIN